MKKLERTVIIGIVGGIIMFSSISGLHAQTPQAQINDTSVKLVTRIVGSGNASYMLPNQSSSAEANCDVNETVTGGGGIASSQQGAFLRESRPIGNGWQVSGINPTSETVDLFAYAVCAHLAPEQ